MKLLKDIGLRRDMLGLHVKNSTWKVHNTLVEGEDPLSTSVHSGLGSVHSGLGVYTADWD
jgi:hypothetical protein